MSRERWEDIKDDLERWFFGGRTWSDVQGRTEIGDWRTILHEACKRIAQLEAERADLVGILRDVHEDIEDYVDVDDGSDGPRPNWAMRLDARIGQIVAKHKEQA